MEVVSVGMFKLSWPVRKVLHNMIESQAFHNVGYLETSVLTGLSIHIVLIPPSKAAEFTSMVNSYMESIRGEFS